jgi:S1-C subfamily serine protease
MLRALALASLVLVLPPTAMAQAPGILRIRVVLVAADGQATVVPRYGLLISDEPPTTSPNRIVTSADGTAELRLRPGTYVVESDQPLAFQGQAYQWTETVDVVAGRDAVLELTAANAEVVPLTPEVAAAAAASMASPAIDASATLMTWRDSVVEIWTPTTHASGFVIGANGLVATSSRAIGTATSVEVQLSPSVKVAASILATGPTRDVAVLRIDPTRTASMKPVPLGCADGAPPTVEAGQRVLTVGAPFRQPKETTSGTVSRVEAHTIVSDLVLPTGTAGGPVFSPSGGVVGLTAVDGENASRRRESVLVVRVEEICEVVSSAEKQMANAGPPSGTLLPVEPARPFPLEALKEMAQRRVGSLNPYQMSASDFDIAFMTPVHIYGAQNRAEIMRRDRSQAAPSATIDQAGAGPLVDFGNWSDYVRDAPPVLLVRVTPKQVEGFWTKVARGAAVTQGVSLPAFKRFTSGFLRMRALCGDGEVTPIHPFEIEHRVSETDVIDEGLYVFDPSALGPSCASVKLVLYSRKEPEKADTRVVDPKFVQQIWQDFALYRALP